MKQPPNNIACFAMVAVGVFLSTMDSSMMNIALPFIMGSFQSTLAEAELVVLIYLLTITSSLLIWGKISDRLGKGTIYLCGMLVFSIGALFCYFSPDLKILIASRFLQGVGAAMMMSTGPAIIRLVMPQDQIGKWLGSLGIATSFGLMSGPLVGGFVIHNIHWRAIFLFNVPISITVFLLGWFFIAGRLPRFNNDGDNFDWLGSVLWIFLIGSIVYMLNSHDTVLSLRKSFGFLLFLIFLFIFVLHELRCSFSLLPTNLLQNRFYIVGMVTAALSFAVLFFVLILMPFYLSYIKGLSVDSIGYVMMAVPVCLFVVSPVSGRLYDRFGAKYLTSAGLFLSGAAIILIALIDADSSILNISLRLALLGCGQSIFLSPNTASVLSRVTMQETGITSGMLATCRNLGMLLGVAAVGFIFSVFFSYFSNGMFLKEFDNSLIEPFMLSFRATLLISSAIAFAGVFLSLRR